MVYAAILILLLTLIVGWKLTARSSYESADYNVLESDGPLEVRAYPDLMLVTTGMKSRGNNGSFGRLFRYISGGNDMAVKVAMTTPVFMEPEGRGTEGQMGFVVPVNVAANQIPNPTDGAVQIQKRRRSIWRDSLLRRNGRGNNRCKRRETSAVDYRPRLHRK